VKDSKLNFTLDFKSHESIAVSGTLKDGKLSGEFRLKGSHRRGKLREKQLLLLRARMLK